MDGISRVTPTPPRPGPAPGPAPEPAKDQALHAAAEALEAQFLTEMLKSAGFGEAREAFGGGVGEEQFTSYLRREQATEMARTGGIGLAESIFEALKRRADNAG